MIYTGVLGAFDAVLARFLLARYPPGDLVPPEPPIDTGDGSDGSMGGGGGLGPSGGGFATYGPHVSIAGNDPFGG